MLPGATQPTSPTLCLCSAQAELLCRPRAPTPTPQQFSGNREDGVSATYYLYWEVKGADPQGVSISKIIGQRPNVI